MKYIATFYSHYGAMKFKKNCDELGIRAKLKPVPRFLSSSCGTCVEFDAGDGLLQGSDFDVDSLKNEETEQIVNV